MIPRFANFLDLNDPQALLRPLVSPDIWDMIYHSLNQFECNQIQKLTNCFSNIYMLDTFKPAVDVRFLSRVHFDLQLLSCGRAATMLHLFCGTRSLLQYRGAFDCSMCSFEPTFNHISCSTWSTANVAWQGRKKRVCNLQSLLQRHKKYSALPRCYGEETHSHLASKVLIFSTTSANFETSSLNFLRTKTSKQSFSTRTRCVWIPLSRAGCLTVHSSRMC